ncbi:type 1 pili tip component [Spartinivicinus poritis]|uniref:Type 1 pili tip component n=1 Tax=Spartinivicinus poritis TaxID=2994640 RepID=A0ABT5U6B9_9GAMM|nr:type 1 pili tip component [Spartinivicinus sp. A2-2]MDE1461900.1 type 1 pili tip component [Spartinivicinus sp. A2-2]
MKIRNLLELWGSPDKEQRTRKFYEIRLTQHDAAKVAAIADLYKGRSEQQIITDLLTAALDELEEAFPYQPGAKVVAHDEDGNPIYEDVGLTPQFISLTKQHLASMQSE